MLELEFPCLREEGDVAGIRAGESAFDVVDSELVEPFGDQQLVGNREADSLALRAVTERRAPPTEEEPPDEVDELFRGGS